MANFIQNLALKYRPQQFSDLAGQKYVSKVLQKIAVSKDIRNAYLFFGTRGSGKTSCARIFAKSINCLSSDNGEPCNKCVICKEIDSGGSVDVQEIDSASFGLVDNMRQLKESTQYQNLNSAYKVIILDEAQMISKEGFGALLKVLEETPKNVVFILVTTEYDKIPDTIQSRCINLNFGKVSNSDILARLSQICEKEGVKYDQGVLEIVSKRSDGSLRDSIMTLEQLCVYSDDNYLNLAKVKQILGVLEDGVFEDILNSLKNKDLKSIIHSLLIVEQKNISYVWFLDRLAYFLRSILLSKFNLVINSDIEVKKFSEVWDEKQLVSMIEGVYNLMDRVSRFPFAQKTMISNHFLALLLK
jgi:DNA polymerase III subunit gamma/tau